MTKLRPPSVREKRLLIAIAVMILAVVCLRLAIIPAAEAMDSASTAAAARRAEYRKLKANIEVKPQIDQVFSTLGKETSQKGSDQSTLSLWLRDMESLAHQPGLTLTAMKPQPIKSDAVAKTYRVRLTLTGNLPAVLRFVAATMDRFPTLGVDSFALRGVQVANQVECQLALRLIRLPDSETAEGAAWRREGGNGARPH